LHSFLTPFRKEHIEFIEMREFDKIAFSSLSDPLALAAAYEQAGYSWTGIVDDKIVFCGGVYPTWEHCGIAWMLSSMITEQHKIFLHRSIKNIIKNSMEALKLHRLEISVAEGHIKGYRWAEVLGFTYEGMMLKYDSQGNNYRRYALIKEVV